MTEFRKLGTVPAIKDGTDPFAGGSHGNDAAMDGGPGSGPQSASEPKSGARLSGRGKVSPEAEKSFAEEIARGRKPE
jgi:hypothetical protein